MITKIHLAHFQFPGFIRTRLTVERTIMKTLACQISSTLMQLLFSFYQNMNVEKTLIKTLAFGHESWETLKTNIDKKQCFLVFLGLCIRDRSSCISSLIGLGLN